MGFSYIPSPGGQSAELVAQVAAKAESAALDAAVINAATRLIQTQRITAQLVEKGKI